MENSEEMKDTAILRRQ